MKSYKITLTNTSTGKTRELQTDIFVLMIDGDEMLHMSEPDAADRLLGGTKLAGHDTIPASLMSDIMSTDAPMPSIQEEAEKQPVKRKPSKTSLKALSDKVRKMGDNH